MIQFEIKYIKLYGDEREVLAFLILSPFEELNEIKGITDLDDLENYIEWLNELINDNIPNYLKPGVIIYSPILWGSEKSKVAEIGNNKKIIGNQQFDTREFLEICYAWRDFLLQNGVSSS